MQRYVRSILGSYPCWALDKLRMQEEKSLQTKEAHVVESIVENVKVDIGVQDQVKKEIFSLF